MAGETPSTLRFADRRNQGRLEVSRSDGDPVAFIARARFVQRFTAFTPDGSVLCRARHRHALSHFMDLFAGDGSSLGHVQHSGRRHQVVLRDGRSLQLNVRWFGQGWVLVDTDGTEVLTSVRRAVSTRSLEQLETGRIPEGSPSIRGYRFHHESFLRVGPDDWLVTPDDSLDLAQTVAVVEAYRILVKAARNQNASA